MSAPSRAEVVGMDALIGNPMQVSYNGFKHLMRVHGAAGAASAAVQDRKGAHA